MPSWKCNNEIRKASFLPKLTRLSATFYVGMYG
jgi:hypothetical protein